MSDKLVEIRTNDGIVLVFHENTMPFDTWRLINEARHRMKKKQNPGEATETGFEVVQHPVTCGEQRDKTLNIEQELIDKRIEGYGIALLLSSNIFLICFWLCYLCYNK